MAKGAAKPKVPVLIIEDEPMLQEAYSHILTYRGYDVMVASNGIEGLEQLKKKQPKVILLDVLMPQLDGIGFLRQADIRRSYPQTKVIACTNLSDRATADKMAALGADRQVLKSDLSPAELVALVDELAL